jgi:hypothetical protein
MKNLLQESKKKICNCNYKKIVVQFLIRFLFNKFNSIKYIKQRNKHRSNLFNIQKYLVFYNSINQICGQHFYAIFVFLHFKGTGITPKNIYFNTVAEFMSTTSTLWDKKLI